MMEEGEWKGRRENSHLLLLRRPWLFPFEAELLLTAYCETTYERKMERKETRERSREE
jgi:hypothetical protein